jgi:hypothetical protein
MLVACVSKSRPQGIDMISQEPRISIGEIDCEKVTASWNEVAPIVRH